MDPITQLGQAFGLTDTHLLVALLVLSILFNVLGRLIPDDATGVLGVVRKISKILGLYVSNRLSSQTTVNEVAARLQTATIRVRDPLTGKFK